MPYDTDITLITFRHGLHVTVFSVTLFGKKVPESEKVIQNFLDENPEGLKESLF